MIAPWIVYAIVLSMAIGAIALLAERIARWTMRPTRWVWAMGIVVMVALPVLLAVRAPESIPSTSTAVVLSGAAPSLPRPSSSPGTSFDTPLLLLWLLASLGIGARMTVTAFALARRRKLWPAAEIDGANVLLAQEAGPAVIGLRRPMMVLPRWALTLDHQDRALMLRHEAEHIRSRDPWLRGAATTALVLMPWNAGLWWALHRLRLAVEIDCDRRLLAHGVDPHRYASLLLEVGERHSATPFSWATAFAEPRSSLETRIMVMATPIRPRRSVLATGMLVALMAVIVVAACQAPVPAGVLPAAGSSGSPKLKELAYHGPGQPSELIPDTLVGWCEMHSTCPGGPGPDSVIEFVRRPPKVTVYLNSRMIGPHDSLEDECEIHSYCNGNVATGRRNDTALVFLDDTTFARRTGAPMKRLQGQGTGTRSVPALYRAGSFEDAVPARVGEKLCAIKGTGEPVRVTAGAKVATGDTICVYRGRGD